MTFQLIEHDANLSVVALPDAVDLYTGAGVRAAGEALLDSGCRYLVLDTSAVTCLDSTGITVFLAFWQRLAGTGGALVLAVPDAHLLRRLTLLGLDTVFNITPTLEEAVVQARRLRAHPAGRPAAPPGTRTEIA